MIDRLEALASELIAVRTILAEDAEATPTREAWNAVRCVDEAHRNTIDAAAWLEKGRP